MRPVNQAQSLSSGILQFFETCVDSEQFDSRLDLAIREWARRSEAVRAEVDRADNLRVKALTDFFTRFNYPMPEAFIRARVIYYTQIGFYALDVKESLGTRISYTESYYLAFTGRQLDSVEAATFRVHIMQKYGNNPA